MRYIVKVRIVGFQSHENTTVAFGPGVNAITGPSDNGKSAVLRAIKWCLWNQGPDGFVRDGCTLTQVEVTFSDDTTILRERNGKRNKYAISVPGQESLALVDFGTRVPEEVIAAHGMRPVQFKAKKASLLNLAGQLEAPFFLDDSPMERADILGRLAGVQVIDRAMDVADRDKRSLSAEIKSLDEQAGRVALELAAYADLDAQEQRVSDAEEILRGIPTLTQRITRLQGLSEQWLDNLQAQDETGWTIERLQGVESAALPLTEAENAHLRVRPLTAAGHQWRQVQADLSATGAALQRLMHTDVAAVRLSEAESAHRALNPIIRTAAQWRQVTAGVAEAERTLTRLANTDAAIQTVTAAAEAEALRKQLVRLQATRDEVRRLWHPTKQVLAHTVGADAAHEQVTQAQDQQTRLERLKTLRTAHAKTQVERTATTRTLESAEVKVRAASALEAGTAAQDRLNVLCGLRTRQGETQAATARGRSYMTAVDERVTASAQEYGQALQDTKICPTCLHVIHPETAAKIAASMINEEAHVHVS